MLSNSKMSSMDYEFITLRQQIRSARRSIDAVQPSTISPGVKLVAILKPDVDVKGKIGPANVFWAKCPDSKKVSQVLKAFAKAQPEPVRLYQGRSPLNAEQTVSSLERDNDLCVVRAIFESEAQLLLTWATPDTQAAPMRDITNAAVNRVALSQPPTAKSNGWSANKNLSSNQNRSTSTGVLHSSDISSLSRYSQTPTAFPPIMSSIYGKGPLELAWTHFVFYQREYRCRPIGGEMQSNLSQVDDSIKQEWEALNPSQRSYFVLSSQRCRFEDIEDHRAFWIYHHDRYDVLHAQGDNPFRTFESTHDFFDQIFAEWKKLDTHSVRAPSAFCLQRARQCCVLTVPVVPANSHLSAGVLSNANQSSAAHENRQESPEMGMPEKIAKELGAQGQLPARVNVSDMFEGKSTEQLELGMATGAEILDTIKAKLTSEPSEESDHWLAAISHLQNQLTRTKTIVGVVGATGAGKSSVINAMLDEERLVPTNCMRACTAVVTEISYNYEETPYRAEIDFIDVKDWEKELKTSFADLFDGSGKVSRECTNEDSEAGIAYAKIRAVYPLMTKDDMEHSSVEALLNHKNVKNLLGSSQNLNDEDALTFYKKLQRYVDSKEKTFSREKKTQAEKLLAKQMEYWPLIRVVRLYVKAPALSTGAVIVDLPGVHDSNQARAAVAQGYLKQCTGLWIVAPITRAVDDKSAKTLLGDTFKRQLKMDGGYNSVTFICSKTDDISITEAQDSLGLDSEMTPLYAKSEALDKEIKELSTKLEDMKDKKSDIIAAIDNADEQLEVWEQLSSDLDDGKTVYAPRPDQSCQKRKRGDESEDEEVTRKKSKYAEDSDDDFVTENDSDQGENENEAASQQTSSEPLTTDAINEKIAELKLVKKEGRRERSALEESMEEIRAQISEINKEQTDIDNVLLDKCIKGRNEYSRGAIQQDFASGIRELDQEIAEEDDAANFNPDVDVRDYDAVAASLPVFCVSARGYQKYRGRLRKDQGATSFQNADDTGIPSLQVHCRKLTEINRETSCKRFLNNLSQLLNSLRLWSSSDGSAANLTDEQKRREAELLDSKLRKLDTAFESTVTKFCNNVRAELQDHVYDKFPTAITSSKNEADDIQARWGAPVNRENRAQGGLYWATYKATVRRDGVFSANDFNHDLTEPILKHVTPGWEKVFSRRLPQTLSGFAGEIIQILTTFHNDVEKRAIRNNLSVAPFQMLKSQLSTFKEVAQDAANSAKDFIITQQKDINRSFVPKITEAMVPVYINTTAEVGPGQYKRMKAQMEAHVRTAKLTMFHASLEYVQDLLKKMVKDAEGVMLTKIDSVFVVIKRDYESVVIGKSRNAKQNPSLPMQQRKLRKEIFDIIDNVASVMDDVLDPAKQDTKERSDQDAKDEQSADHFRSQAGDGEASLSNEQSSITSGKGKTETPFENMTEDSSRIKTETDATNVSVDKLGTPIDSNAGDASPADNQDTETTDLDHSAKPSGASD